jgi:CubicO group peptidase (beta-lactamase class C family)
MLVDRPFAPNSATTFGETTALLVVHRGRLVTERYADGVDASTTHAAWSLTKSVLHAAVGILVGQGAISLDTRIEHPCWGPDDPRQAITVGDLLRMRDGLHWNEAYTDNGDSDVVAMLWGEGKADTAGYCASRPLAHPPGQHFAYSSGTSNLLSAAAACALGGQRDLMEAFLRHHLFDVVGMRSATPKFDAAGTWIASTYCFMTPQDLARFGLLYLRDGIWAGQRILPDGWVDRGRTPQCDAYDNDGAWRHGEHWWALSADPEVFFAHGFRSQVLMADPRRDTLVVRMGTSTPEQSGAVMGLAHTLGSMFPLLTSDAP